MTTSPVPTSNLPLKYTARPTVAAITPGDLMSRLYVFADDSMLGRQVGFDGNLKGTQYIADQAKRIGLIPAGDNGTYFQDLPVYSRVLDRASTITAGNTTLVAGRDFVASGTPISATGGQVIFGGVEYDTLSLLDSSLVAGKILVLTPNESNVSFRAFAQTPGYQRYRSSVGGALTTVNIRGPQLSDAITRPALMGTSISLRSATPAIGGRFRGFSISATNSAGAALFGAPLSSLKKGALGSTITMNIHQTEASRPGRNVVAILPGSDPKLKGEYIAIGAHNDHIGFNHSPVEHDSLRAFNTVARPGGQEGSPKVPTTEEWARINFLKDSLRAAHGGPRMDSVYNGADDDGTGSVGVLEIAQALAAASVKPKRSIIFVWHTGEEAGMWGSGYFTDHPTVPRDSIVTQLNIDMIGRGSADDAVPNGGPSYVQIIGSKRLSTELGDIVEGVNTDTHAGFAFDYSFDTPGNPNQYYCRSDHWSYAKWGIPITFFSTGGHRDYHMLTDEPQYIDYNHFARVAQLVQDVAVKVANLDHAVVVDKPKGNPTDRCRQ
ncbi:MAG: M20/M25/M40 family metallo-hydrolase [Gemmatimonadales bacterium]